MNAERLDALLGDLSDKPFSVDIALDTNAFLVRWGIPVALLPRSVSENAERAALYMASKVPNLSAAEHYQWFRDKARALDARDRIADIGTLLYQLIKSTEGLVPQAARTESFHRSASYPGPVRGDIQYFFAVAYDFPEDSLWQARLDEASIVDALSDVKGQSLFLECCHDVRIVDARMDFRSIDLPGAKTRFPFASDELDAERRKRIKLANQGGA